MALRLLSARTVPARRRADTGFSLIEVLIAVTALLVSLLWLTQLLAVAAVTTRRARALTQAAVFAQEKMEALLSQAATGQLVGSSPDALAQNVEGFCDFLDASGLVVASGAGQPRTAAYIRRWTIEPIGGASTPMLALRVFVADRSRVGATAHIATVVRQVP